MLSAKTILNGSGLRSHSYSTRKILNIKDKTIIFPKDYFEEVQLNGITSFVFKGILSYQPVHCEHGGTLFDSNFKNHRRKVKRYGRLFLKSPTLIDTTTYLSIYCFKQPMCEIDILNFFKIIFRKDDRFIFNI